MTGTLRAGHWRYEGRRWNEYAWAQTAALFGQAYDWRELAWGHFGTVMQAVRESFGADLRAAGLDPGQYTIRYDTTPLQMRPCTGTWCPPKPVLPHPSPPDVQALIRRYVLNTMARQMGVPGFLWALEESADEPVRKAVSVPEWIGDHRGETRQEFWRRIYGGDP